METSAIAFKCRPFICQMEKLQEFFDYYYHASEDPTQKDLLLTASARFREATNAIREVVKNGP
jgi:hypothetical protein